MNPLSPKWVIELFLLLISFYRVSRVLTDDKYGEEAWLLVACSILQPICSLQLRIPRCPQVPRTGEQHLNSLADTGTCQTKVIVFVIVLDMQLAADLRFHVASLSVSLCSGAACTSKCCTSASCFASVCIKQ